MTSVDTSLLDSIIAHLESFVNPRLKSLRRMNAPVYGLLRATGMPVAGLRIIKFFQLLAQSLYTASFICDRRS